MRLFSRALTALAFVLATCDVAMATPTPVLGQSQVVDEQTGTSYTVPCADNGGYLSLNNGAAVAVTLPTPGTSCYLTGFSVDIMNNGVGTVTVTPTTGLIAGASAITLPSGQGATVYSDGTNYVIQAGGGGSGGAAGSVTATGGADNLITNGGFGLDQANEGSGPTPASSTAVRVADRWFSQWVVSTSGAGNPTISQAATATGLTLSSKELKITANATPGTTQPAALNFITYQSIEGQDVADLQEGTAAAQSFTVSVWLKSSISGTFDVFVQNGAAAQSYSHDCALTAATWAQCTFVVPGDATGTWNRVRDTIGMVIGATAACGSTFQQTGNAWATSTSNCTSNQTALTNNASATLEMTGVKVQRGTFATQWTAEPAAVLLAKGERFYRKSFTQGTAPAQNVGTGHGEACYQNPIANGEGSITLGFPEMYNGTPTTTLYNPGATNANFRDETGSADVTAGSAVTNTTNLYLPTGATVTTIAHKVCVNYTVDMGF